MTANHNTVIAFSLGEIKKIGGCIGEYKLVTEETRVRSPHDAIQDLATGTNIHFTVLESEELWETLSTDMPNHDR